MSSTPTSGHPDDTTGRASARARRDGAVAATLAARLSERALGTLDARTARSVRRVLANLDERQALDRRLTAACEASVALRLLERGRPFEFEVPAPSGREVDFLVHGEPDSFALHVKRWAAPSVAGPRLVVPPRVRDLETVRRPYVLGVRWPAGARAMRRYVDEVSRFLTHARVGDELVFRADDGTPAGGARVLAPWSGPNVLVTVGLEAADADEGRRIQRLLRKAHAQFLPGVPNAILLCGGDPDLAQRDVRLVDIALRGAHVERWDRLPARGQRVAHGRADDGFWTGSRYAGSDVVAWCPFDPESAGLARGEVWLRQQALERDGAANAPSRATDAERLADEMRSLFV